MNRDSILPSVLTPNLALLFVIALGFAFEPAPLESRRPPAGDPAAAPSGPSNALDTTRTPARLWEDPLDRASFPPTPDPPPCRGESTGTPAGLPIRPRPVEAQTAPPAQSLVLVLPFSGRDYPDDRETRLRARYAVVSALGRAGFIPCDRENLRRAYLTLSTPDSRSLPAPIALAWEQYEPIKLLYSDARGGGFTDVTVVWVDAEQLTQYVIQTDPPHATVQPAHLHERFEWLIGALCARWPDYAQAQWTIVGPQHSDHLEELYLSHGAITAPGGSSAPGIEPAATVTVYSPRATMPQELLRGHYPAPSDWTKSSLPEWLLRTLHATPPAWIKRTIPDDQKVCEALVTELALRTSRPPARQRIALIGEWDTVYGRTITRAFSVALQRSRFATSPTEQQRINSLAVWEQRAPNVQEFSYLRGLDGTAGKTATEARGVAATAQASNKAETPAPAPIDHPTGNSQFDYLRRLAEQVTGFDQECKATHSRLAAVGVLGSDTYDKLLVLRALRPLLPNTRFFTTDIDAAFLSADELPYTRNLVVASGYGLTLDAAYQGTIPPFRDGYQTALFATCLQILGARPEPMGERPPPPLIATTPRVFEIGTHGLIPLGGTATTHFPGGAVIVVALIALASALWVASASGVVTFAGEGNHCLIQGEPENLRCLLAIAIGLLWCTGMIGWLAVVPSWLPHDGTGRLLVPALFALLVAGAYNLMQFLSVAENTHPSTGEPAPVTTILKHGCASPRIIGLLSIAALGTLLLIQKVATVIGNPNEEPFSWASGISCWPSDLIRLLAIGLAVTFSVLVERRISAATRAAGGARPSARADHPTHAARPSDGPTDGAGEGLQDRPRPEPPALLRSFHASLAPNKRHLPITLYGVAFLALIGVVYAVSGEFELSPARGAASRAIDRAVLAVSFLAFLYLLFFVIDTVFRGASVVSQLTPDTDRIEPAEAFSQMTLIRELIEPLNTLIYYPFGVLFALVASRHSAFDNWTWPLGLVATFGLALVLLVASALVLQSRARAARETIIGAINARLREKCEAKEQLEETRRQIESLTGAAYTSWHRNPVFYALLIPLGGMGSIEVIQKVIGLLSLE